MRTLAANKTQEQSEQAKLDKELAHIMQTGKRALAEKAFVQIYQRYKSPLFFKVILKAVRNEDVAEDLTQEIFAKIFMNIKQYDHSTALSTWMYNLAKNHVIDHIRRQKYEVLSLEGLKSEFGNDDDVSEMVFQIEDKSSDTFAELVKGERAEFVRQAFRKGVKSPEARRVIRMIFLEELSYEETSQRMKLPLGTVKCLMHRAKGEMKDFLSRKSLDFTYVN